MSRETIIAELPEHFVRQLRDWVRSRSGNSFAMTGAYDGMRAGNGYAETQIPILYGAVGDLDVAMLAIPIRERSAVQLFWEREGLSLRWMGRRLAVNRETVEARVRRGHALLRDQLLLITFRAACYHEAARKICAFS